MDENDLHVTHGMPSGFQVAGFKLQDTSFKLQASSSKPQAAGYKLQVTESLKPET
jgi:hypothetical protein